VSLFAAQRRDETLQGIVESVVYRSHDGFFSVIRLLAEPDGREVTAVGDLGTVSPGETLRLRGRFTEHASHGRRFQTESFTPVLPSSCDGIARYLGSGLVPGIGKGLAERLVAQFGERAIDVIATQSGRLREVPGIGKQRAQAIAKAVRERRDETELMAYLHGLGLGPAMAKRLRRRYGERAVQVIREDPYRVAQEVPGIGFRTADGMGRASGLSLDDPRRAAGAILHLLGEQAEAGHVFSHVATLVEAAGALDIPEVCAEAAIEALSGTELVTREGDAVYATPLYEAEVEVAQNLRDRVAAASLADAPLPPIDMANLSEEQAAAVRATLRARVLVLTGGPGTGKTTTVRGIVAAHRALDHSVALCAPTGRAAKRLSEAAGVEAKTIHRLLEWNPASARFARDEHTPVEADVVLVDEASMLNLQLTQHLLRAIPRHVTLVLVGDVDQLPPVGPGQVLRAVIESRALPVVRLSTVFRQAGESAIVKGAHAVLAGRVPEKSPAFTRGKGELFIVRTRDVDTALERLRELMRRVGQAYGLDPKRDIMVLSPMRKGPLGTERLNAVLQAELNPEGEGQAARTPMRAGDRVMQLVNDYEKETFNGDLGEVRSIQGGVVYVNIDGREVRYKHDDLDQLALAYASTIHKVQGSEFPGVFIVLHTSHHVLLTRALLYTAITRGKQLVVLLGDDRAIARAVGNAESYECRSQLVARLRQESDGNVG
jgi:exodeoxyribonuclease V alpha subunit